MTIRNYNSLETTRSLYRKDQAQTKAHGSEVMSNHWYSIPKPVRHIFDQFPLVVYKENVLPQRSKRRGERHILHVFANTFDTSDSEISCNPTCLKWQAYLKFNEIEFASVPSNNHASPSGSLPFLIPRSQSSPTSQPLTTAKIPQWISKEIMQEEEMLSMEHEAYMALVDQNIRNAWLYHLYLDTSNFANVAHPLYVATTSSNPFIQSAIAHQLREAAKSELLKSREMIDGDELYSGARKAFRALSVLLGERSFFSSEARPGLFDASVFAYTHLLLDQTLPWKNTSLSSLLRQHTPLVEHCQKILSIYKKG